MQSLSCCFFGKKMYSSMYFCFLRFCDLAGRQQTVSNHLMELHNTIIYSVIRTMSFRRLIQLLFPKFAPHKLHMLSEYKLTKTRTIKRIEWVFVLYQRNNSPYCSRDAACMPYRFVCLQTVLSLFHQEPL